jgi:hypothetical protein
LTAKWPVEVCATEHLSVKPVHPPSRSRLPRIGQPGALGICLVMRDQDDDRFERAALRWIARFGLERRNVTLDAIQTAAAALAAMPDKPERAITTLGNLCAEYGVSVAH